jgi:predicted DNA-binding transcriptional regulator YafY
MLEELGIPIVAERGRFGGYALVAGFKLPPLIFTDDEALALSVGLLAARGLGLAHAAPAVAGAQAKLQRVMPPALKRRLRAIDETVALDLSRANASPEDNAALVTLSAAAQARQRVRLDYRSGQEQVTARNFDPYGLVWRGGRWYAVGHCHLRRDVRSFRLDRVIGVRALPASFGRPDEFDALAHLARSVATMPRAHAIEVLLHTTSIARGARLSTPSACSRRRRRRAALAQADNLDWFARSWGGCHSISRCCRRRAAQGSAAAKRQAAPAGGGRIRSS